MIKKILIFLLIGLIGWFLFCLPNPLFNSPTSTVVVDRNNELLGARIASNGQWHFPHNDSVPYKFAVAIQYFEDEYFYKHPGINPVSLFRAFKQNIKAKKNVSGGSTITMQVIRLSRQGKKRNIYQKAIECILSIRAEIRYSKKEILSLYSSNAPFGGNVIGLDAASWRYFGQKPQNLSWAEAVTLAVLPNAPSLIYPGKNRDELKRKRDLLLLKLKEKGVLDQFDYELAIDEPLPEKPFSLPNHAIHLINRAKKEGYDGQVIRSTLNLPLQNQVNQIINRYSKEFQNNEIYNAAAIILEVETGNVLVYIGNTQDKENLHNNEVDVISSPRSSGSILKPFLYASMTMDGDILPQTLIADIPTQIAGYSPKNFDKTYDGAVPAHEALFRSLNIPFVKMLQQYSTDKFYHKLKKLNISTLTNSAGHYGLSLILGGAEVRLDELTACYASMARSLNHFNSYNSMYDIADFHAINYIYISKAKSDNIVHEKTAVIDAASSWLTFEAMKNVNRPYQETGWENYSSSQQIAWKTGTSFGFRDGWSIGITPEHVVGVWIGNATGEGRPGLTGLNTAAPLMFEIFKLLPTNKWFSPPYDELVKIPVCKESGYRASLNCDDIDSVYVHAAGLRSEKCPYHQIIHIDKNGDRVTAECSDVYEMKHVSWFVLPPVQEWYYRQKHPNYKVLPPLSVKCQQNTKKQSMDVIYPRELTRIFIPIELDGQIGKVIFQVAHRSSETTIFWHIDNTYIGQTKGIHEMNINVMPGKHYLTLVDEFGETITRQFEILGKR